MSQQPARVSPDGRWLWTGTQWVPNVAPVPTAPVGVPWARPYESARSRANLVMIFLLVNVVGILLLIALQVVDIIQLSQVGTPSDAQTILIALLALAGLIVFLGSYIPAIVFFCMWLHRAIRDMPALGRAVPRWSPAG